jgi:gliding motility-associated-like protein
MLLDCLVVFATHYRAGEITYRQLVGSLYEVTVDTYTDPRSEANPNTISITIDWGDGTSQTVQRQGQAVQLPNNVQRNRYVAQHNYQTSFGIFKVSVTDPNRVNNILNINRGFTIDLAFYIESFIYINESGIGSNQSPILLNPPIDNGCINFLYTHNPSAFDPDGDSLVYRIIPPKYLNGQDVPLYIDPFHTDSFKINPITGTLFWAKPMQAGIYNIAIQIIELRNGIVVGAITRDMQITIEDCPNSPPFIEPMSDDCVKVGQNFSRTISASDINSSQQIKLEGIGGPFAQANNRATLNPPAPQGSSPLNAQFNWTPACFNIRNQAYQILFKAVDNFPRVPGNYVDGFFLKVNAPEPINVNVAQEGRNAIKIWWSPDVCRLATRYLIYKRIDSSGWTPSRCETGVPEYTGFKLVANKEVVTNPNDTTFVDDENGIGLNTLTNYCYRIVAVYPARSATGLVIGGRVDESFASAEVCGSIVRSSPVIMQNSVITTSPTNGLIDLAYLKPDTLDTIQYIAPYRIILNRKGNSEAIFTAIGSRDFNSFASIRDSVWSDSNINTQSEQWTYRLDLTSASNTTPIFVDSSDKASSVFLQIGSSDRINVISWDTYVPWVNDTIIVYRQNNLTFDSIGFSVSNVYIDTGLINGQEYCYYLQTRGAYSMLPIRINNLSQIRCGTPIDTIAPCAPKLTVIPPCDDFGNFSTQLNWISDLACADDAIEYKIFYKANPEDSFTYLSSLPVSQTSYLDTRDILRKSIAGCYAVTAIDSNGNESDKINIQCIDNCPIYAIPNVFTPNGDNVNDILIPFDYRFVESINLVIYNRWGVQVFSTNNPDILWDGTSQPNGDRVADGVYFYTCLVFERFLDGTKTRKLHGTITIISEK